MKTRYVAMFLLFAATLLPLDARAFSFGTFLPGDTIVEIELSAAVSTGVTLATGADPAAFSDTTLTFESSVSTITMASGAVFNVDLGTVLVSSTVMPVAGTGVFFESIIGADFANGIVADLSITDIGVGGSGLLLEADYIGAVVFNASKTGALPTTGSLDGDFTVIGGDTDFTIPFGTAGNFFSELAGFLPSSGLCDLTNGFALSGLCLGATDFADFTTNPTTTITPVPEPGTLLLLGLVLGAAGVVRRR